MKKLIKWILEKISDYPRIIKEIFLYFGYLKQINVEKSKSKFRRLKLRVDWIGRIYTVINLNEQEAQWDEAEKRNLLLDKLEEVNFYLTSLNLQEIITPNIRPIASFEKIDEEKELIAKHDYAYLVTYTYLFNYFNLWFIIKHVLITLISYYVWNHHGDKILNTINKIIEFISVYLN